jgi:hypothetical protein
VEKLILPLHRELVEIHAEVKQMTGGGGGDDMKLSGDFAGALLAIQDWLIAARRTLDGL